VSAPPLSLLPFINDKDLTYLFIGAVVFVAFVIGSRFVSNRVVAALHRRNMRADVVQIGGRVATVVLIGLGVWFAIGFAFQSQNFTLAGILLATIVASFGVQDLLKDYVSGYYVLLERHIRVGDRISMEGVVSGTVEAIKLRVTLLKNESGDLVVVPNAELFNKAVLVHVRAAERVAETSGPAPTPAPPAPLAKPAPHE
jgi:small conductance mechanosensitive channel